jgi:hypothetical protein
MKAQQITLQPGTGWTDSGPMPENPQLVLAFGPVELIDSNENYSYLRNRFPDSHLLMASTSGDIRGTEVLDDSIVATALQFEKTKIKVIQERITDKANAFEMGKSIYQKLNGDDLVHILVLSDGILVNGSELVGGLNFYNDTRILVTGGLSGDNARFIRTLVGLDEFPATGNVVGIGFYGKHLKVGHGSRGGWDAFGPERIVTRSDRNILYELDNQSALELYKKYLGDLTKELPGSALLFPLSLKLPDSDEILVRTILSVDENEQSMTFAGNLPKGSRVQFMKANFERIIDAAGSAASHSLSTAGTESPEFALLVSCVGRKMILNQRVEDEVEEAVNVLGAKTVVTGFYSNGEISPVLTMPKCELHNQTMTITTYREI